jgi:hypothetical protein
VIKVAVSAITSNQLQGRLHQQRATNARAAGNFSCRFFLEHAQASISSTTERESERENKRCQINDVVPLRRHAAMLP